MPARFRRVLLLLAASLFAGCPARAERLRILEDPAEAARVRTDLIRSAREVPALTVFVVGVDSVSVGVLALLRDAARRGVRVRLLIDAQWNRIPEALQAHLVAEGVGIREYHPFRPWKPRWWTRRLHDKILVVDAGHLVVGGRNIESPYYGRGGEVGRRDYVDRDAYVAGASAAAALAYFDASARR